MSNGLSSQFLRGSAAHYAPLAHPVGATSSGSPLYDSGTGLELSDSQFDTSPHSRLTSTWTPVTPPSMWRHSSVSIPFPNHLFKDLLPVLFLDLAFAPQWEMRLAWETNFFREFKSLLYTSSEMRVAHYHQSWRLWNWHYTFSLTINCWFHKTPLTVI